MDNKTRTISQRFANAIDHWLLPVTLGALSVLVLTQIVTTIPSVRQKVDQVEGRFIVYPSSSAFLSSAQQTAYIRLYLSPATVHGVQIKVLDAGQTVATLSHGSVRVPVHSGSKLTIRAQSLDQTVHISVDHNNPALVRPAPGRTVVLSPQHLQATLPTARFIK